MVIRGDQGHGQDQQEPARDGTIAGIEKRDSGEESSEDGHVARGEAAVVPSAVEPVKVVARLVCKPDPRVGPPENILAEPFQQIGKGDGATGELKKTVIAR